MLISAVWVEVTLDITETRRESIPGNFVEFVGSRGIDSEVAITTLRSVDSNSYKLLVSYSVVSDCVVKYS